MPVGFRKGLFGDNNSPSKSAIQPSKEKVDSNVDEPIEERTIFSHFRRPIAPFTSSGGSSGGGMGDAARGETVSIQNVNTDSVKSTSLKEHYSMQTDGANSDAGDRHDTFQLRRTSSLLRSNAFGHSQEVTEDLNDSADGVYQNATQISGSPASFRDSTSNAGTPNAKLTGSREEQFLATGSPIARSSLSFSNSRELSPSKAVLDHNLTKMLRPQSKSQLIDAQELAAWAEKKWVWIEDANEGYIAGSTVEMLENGEKARIKMVNSANELIVETSALQRMNPPKFDKSEDMADLTYLNELSVLHNLKERYYSNLIYTYSGLFLIAINPYRGLPIYTDEILKLYVRRKRKEIPPHVFAVADEAYRMMLENCENQSILITGESGAGKTENTKKVIQYLATIAAESPKTNQELSQHSGLVGNFGNVDAKLLAANPILESFGNAQTVRNNNSSRFGKFIKIEFNQFGQIVSAHIEQYLLEKSRVTHQSSRERNFHIFYQFLSGASSALKESLFIKGGLNDYNFVKHSNHRIDGVDDKQEFEMLLNAMNTIQFSKEEQESFFKIIAAILHFGNIEVLEEESTGHPYIGNTALIEKISTLLGIGVKEFTRALLQPMIRAGKDWVVQERTRDQVIYSIEALCRALYDRMFGLLVEKINRSLEKPSSRSNFIGVLDIAGFEIFDSNSFEQLCINYTNEKLQQFFNHHMFVQEQEEYKKEGLEWKHIDFGLDLQPVIDLIERNNPIGILPCLDEECVMPKATDRTFGEKLNATWKTKSSIYEQKRFNDGFSLKHYAGKVDYSIDGWLDKNKDPLNENITRLLAKSNNSFICQLFGDYDGNEEDIDFMNKCKKGAFRTVAQRHREQLNSLMIQLNSTHPHFIRCILPNDQKKSGSFDPKMVLYQLKCNGVLEGIRVTRQGYPNRLYFIDFVRRYQLIAPVGLIRFGVADSRNSVQQILEYINLDASKYKIGNSKVFFKAGVLAELEDLREHHLSLLLVDIQSRFRAYVARTFFKTTINNMHSIASIQRSCRNYLLLREWPWWKLFSRLRPLLKASKIENQIDSLQQQVDQLQKSLSSEQSNSLNLTQNVHQRESELKKMEMALAKEHSTLLEQAEILQLTRERFSQLEDAYKEAVLGKRETEKNLHDLYDESKMVVQRMAQLESSLQDSRLLVDKLERELVRKDRELTEISQSLGTESNKQQSLLEQKKALESYVSRYEQEIAQKTTLLSQSEAKLSDLQGKFVQLEDQRNQVSSEIAALKEELLQKDSNAQSMVKEANQLLKDRDNQIQVLNSHIEERDAIVSQLKNDLSIKIGLKENEIEQLRQGFQEEKVRLNNDLQNLQLIIEKKGDEQTKQMETLMKTKDEEIAALLEKLEQLNQARNALLSENSTLNQLILNQKNELEKLLDSKLVAEKSVSQLSEKLSECEDEIARLNSINGSLQKDVEQLSSNFTDLQATHNALNETNNSLKRDFDALQLELAAAQNESAHLRNSIDNFKVEIEEMSNANTLLEQSKKKLNSEFNELSKKLDESEVMRSESERKLTEKANELGQIKAKLSTEIEQANLSKNEIVSKVTELTMKNDELTASLEKAQKYRSAAQSELEDLKVEFENLSQEYRNSERNSRTWESQFKSSRVDCEELNNQYKNLEVLYKTLLDSTQKDRDENLKITNLLKIKESEIIELNEQLVREKQEAKRRLSLQQSITPTSVEESSDDYCTKKMFDESVARFEGKIALLVQENSQLNSANDRLKNQLSSLEADESVVVSMKSQIRNLEQEISTLNSVVIEQNENYQSREHQFLRQLTDQDIKYETLRDENIDLLDRIKEQMAQLAKLNEELDNRSFELEKANKQKRILQQEVDELKNRLSSESTGKSDDLMARKKLLAELVEVKESLDNLRVTNEELQNELSLAQHKVQSLTVKIDISENNNSQLERQNNELSFQINQQREEIESLLSRADNYFDKIKKYEESIKQFSDEQHSLEIDLQESNAEKRKLTNELNLLNNRIKLDEEERNSNIKRLELRISNELNNLRAELEHERALCTQLREMKRQDDAKYQELASRMETEVSSFVSAKREKERIEIKVEELLATVSSLENALHDKDTLLAGFQGARKDLESTVDLLKDEIESVKKQKSSIHEINTVIAGENSKLKDQLSQSNKRIDELQNEIRYIQGHLEEGTEESSRLMERLKRSEDANANLTQEINKQKTMLFELQRERNALDLQMKGNSIKEIEFETMTIMAKDTKRLEDEISKLCDSRDEIMREKQELYKELKRTERNLLQKDSQVQDLSEEVQKLKGYSTKLEEKNRSTRESVGIMEAKEAEFILNRKRSERIIEQLQDKIRQLENELSKYKNRPSSMSLGAGYGQQQHSRASTPMSVRGVTRTPSVASSNQDTFKAGDNVSISGGPSDQSSTN